MATSTNTKIDWLYPELLSKEGLIEILSQRYVQLPEDTESTSRDDLLDLYYQYIIPRPQRKYRLNRRGRDMGGKKQSVQSRKRKITGPDITAVPAKKKAPEPSSRLLTSFEASPAGDRLKPPPSCINFEKKVIKLGGSRASSDSLGMSIPLPSENNSSESSVSSSPRVKLNRTSSGDAKSPTHAPENVTFNKTIKLINSHLSSSGDSAKKSHNGNKDEEPTEVDNPEAGPEKKVKINKISWP